MRIESNICALWLLAFAILFLVMGLLAGAFACIVVVEFIDLIPTKEATLLFLFAESAVAASFLLSVCVSFFVAFYVIRREGKTRKSEEMRNGH